MDNIYYFTEELSEQIDLYFDFIEQRAWFELYQCRTDKSYWRLDKPDKYQVQFFIRLDSLDNWFEYDSTELEIELLRRSRGILTDNCLWAECNCLRLQGLFLCEVHAYKEMGIRR